MRITKGPIARGTIRTSFVLGLRLVVQAGTLLLVARMLGPHEFGAFAGIAALAVMLGTLATFGTHLVLLGEVSRDPARRTQVLPYAVPFTLLCGTVLLCIYLLICSTALRVAGVPVRVLIAIGVTETLLQPLFGLSTAEHLALGRIARSQLLVVLPLALRLLAAAAVFLLHAANPLAAYGYGYLIASVLALGIAMLTMAESWPNLQLWRLPSKMELREAAGYAALNITAATPTEFDKALATRLLPLAASGLYAAGARVIGAVTLPVVAMMLSALPRLFREGHSQPRSIGRLLRWVFAVALAFSISLSVMMWFIAPAFVWLFGAKYQGIEHAIHWLVFAIPGMAIRIAAGSVLMSMGRPWMRVGFEITGFLVLLAFSILLTPRWGLPGMAISLIIMEWIMAVLGVGCVVYIRRTQAKLNLTA